MGLQVALTNFSYAALCPLPRTQILLSTHWRVWCEDGCGREQGKGDAVDIQQHVVVPCERRYSAT